MKKNGYWVNVNTATIVLYSGHFFLYCQINSGFRIQLINHYNSNDKSFHDYSDTDKLKTILNPSTPADIKTVISFIKQSLELRSEDSNL